MPQLGIRTGESSRSIQEEIITMATQIAQKTEEVIERAMRFPMEEILQRYAQDEELPWGTVLEHERELKRYLALCALSPGVSYGMKGPIDRLWHTFVLFTQRYQAFCQEVGGRFLHHFPAIPGRDDGVKSRQDYERFLLAYEEAYKESPPVYLWPRLRPLAETSADCSDCNCAANCTCGSTCDGSSPPD